MHLTWSNRHTKSIVILKDVPLHEEQSLQIRILEKLAISLVALLFPTSNLTGLVNHRVRERPRTNQWQNGVAIPYRNTRKSRTSSTSSKWPLFDCIPGMSSHLSALLRTAVPCRLASIVRPAGGGRSVTKTN